MKTKKYSKNIAGLCNIGVLFPCINYAPTNKESHFDYGQLNQVSILNHQHLLVKIYYKKSNIKMVKIFI